MVGFVSPQPNPECFLGLLMFEFWVPFICLYKNQDQADQPDILHIPDINAIKNKEFLNHPTNAKDLKTGITWVSVLHQAKLELELLRRRIWHKT